MIQDAITVNNIVRGCICSIISFCNILTRKCVPQKLYYDDNAERKMLKGRAATKDDMSVP